MKRTCANPASTRHSNNGGNGKSPTIKDLRDIVVGDFDSISCDVSQWIEAQETSIHRYPCDKDLTDFEIALEKAISYNPQEIVILGGLGGRMDHIFANCLILFRKIPEEIRVSLFGVDTVLTRVTASSAITFLQTAGSLLSLLSITNETFVKTLSGTRWALHEEKLALGEGRGMSNEIVEDQAMLTLREGAVLAIQVKKSSPDS